MSAGRIERMQATLLRALYPVLGPFTLWSVRSSGWASGTFDGARHRLVLALDGPDAGERAEALAATLGEAELDIAGGFVADIGIETRLEGEAPVLVIEALTIVDEPEARLTPVGRRAG